MNLRKFHAVAIALIASAAFVSQAHAVQITVGSPHGPTVMLTGTTNPGGTINGSGGDFQNSTIGTPPTPLPWVFCVDVLHTIAPPATFTSATVDSTTGIIYGAQVTNANEIAYVLLTYVNGTSLANILSIQGAVQAAILNLEYGGTITSIAADGTISQAQGYVSAAEAANTTGLASLLAWVTPSPDQGVVTILPAPTPTVPEPSSFVIAGLAGLGMLYYARRRRSR